MTDTKTQAQKWIDALRSGSFAQGNGQLYNPDSDAYCCLGVADKVCFNAVFDTLGFDDLDADAYLASPRAQELNLNKRLTAKDAMILSQKTGLSIGNEVQTQSALAELNDAGIPFTEIADILQSLSWWESVTLETAE